jgi:hypothetical protein
MLTFLPSMSSMKTTSLAYMSVTYTTLCINLFSLYKNIKTGWTCWTQAQYGLRFSHQVVFRGGCKLTVNSSGNSHTYISTGKISTGKYSQNGKGVNNG